MTFNHQKTLWISFSAISDFEECPRLYYLKNFYWTPVTQRKIQVVDPYLTLGTVVHRVAEEVESLPPEERKEIPMMHRFERIWNFFSGKRGGFTQGNPEQGFYRRGKAMIARLDNSPLLEKPSYPHGESFPKVRLFEDKDIVLVGSLDWVELLENGGLHVIDFKTSRKEEKEDSLQLPIYLLLGALNFKKPIEKMSYWYLEKDKEPKAKSLQDHSHYIPIIREKALMIKRALDENKLECRLSPDGRCSKCQKYEKAIAGQAEFVGFDRKMNKELYFVE